MTAAACALQDLCAVAPPPTQPLAKLESESSSAKPPLSATRRSTAQDLLQEKYNVKVRCHPVWAGCGEEAGLLPAAHVCTWA